MFPFVSDYGDWGLLALRLALGAIFLAHGWQKIKNLKAASEGFSQMGFKPGRFWGPLVAIVEFFGGMAILIGAYTSFAAALYVAEFLVILVWRLAKHNKLVGGYELDLIIFAAAIALFFYGGGAYSLDRVLYPFVF